MSIFPLNVKKFFHTSQIKDCHSTLGFAMTGAKCPFEIAMQGSAIRGYILPY
jgi:hypothetical protein